MTALLVLAAAVAAGCQAVAAQAPAPSSGGGGLSSTAKILIGVLVGLFAFIIFKSACLYYVCVYRRRHVKSKLAPPDHSDPYNSMGGKSGKSHRSSASGLDQVDWEIDVSDVQICTREDGSLWVIGKGGFGEVFKGIRAGVQDVAIKMVHHSDDDAREKFQSEINMLKFVSRDRNIVQFYGAGVRMADPQALGKPEPRLWLITEYMEGGDLRRALRGERGQRLDWWNGGKQVAIDFARGLAFLHANNVIHRDIKSMNILLAKDGTAKIGDVGMARISSEGYLTNRDAAIGTFAWAAPEMLLNERCTEKVDIYSMGVVLWEIATSLMPVRGSIHTPSAELCPEAVTAIIQECMSRNPEDRPTAKDVYLRLKQVEPCPELATSTILDSASEADGYKSNEKRLQELMATLRQRATDTDSYSGGYSTGYTSGAVTGRINDSAELAERKQRHAAKSSPVGMRIEANGPNDSARQSEANSGVSTGPHTGPLTAPLPRDVLTISPNGDVVVQINGVPERVPEAMQQQILQEAQYRGTLSGTQPAPADNGEV